ncbi:hypothetical protein CPC08DRAFT_814195 [Agrocybe pediades]|nr:hypothetical protein CPC08DRAFT_814195 [Agrocybe pediades]
MSTPSSPTASSPTPSNVTPIISADALAAAAERRTLAAASRSQLTAAQLAVEHERRQKFRRLIDPGITRPNSKERALASLKTLLTICENLIREPDNPKYQQFKPTNSVIKRELVDPKGALEYAIELGFRPEVINFQPYYTFQRQHEESLRIGAVILKEYLDVENEKQERAERSKKNEKAAKEEAALKVKLAYMDDRKAKELRDEMERQQRQAREAAAASRQSPAPQATPRMRSSSPTIAIPGAGHVLAADRGEDAANDVPPAYE